MTSFARRTGLVLATCAVSAAVWLPGALGSSQARPRATFSATLSIAVSASLQYTATETRADGCRHVTKAGGNVGVRLRSERPSPVVLRRVVASYGSQWRLEGRLGPLFGTIGHGYPLGERRAYGCGEEDGTVAGLVCDGAPGHVRGLSARLSGHPGRASLAPIEHAIFAEPIRACDPRSPDAEPRPREELGNVDGPARRIDVRRFLDPRVSPTLIRASSEVVTPLTGDGLEGTVTRRVSWTLTLVRAR